MAGARDQSGRTRRLAGMIPPFRLIELLFMAERTAMPVADDTETPPAVPGYRVISADRSGDGTSLLVPR